MIDLFLLPIEEEDGEDYEVIDVYIMPAPTAQQQKEREEKAVDYEDRIIRASDDIKLFDSSNSTTLEVSSEVIYLPVVRKRFYRQPPP